MGRKEHSGDAGYIAERRSKLTGRKVVIYLAEAQQVDVAGMKYAVVCDAHGTLMGSTSMKDARVMMKYPENFCEDCQRLLERHLG